jgi:hypothetical protein
VVPKHRPTVEAFVETAERTVLSYLTKSVSDQIVKIWRERSYRRRALTIVSFATTATAAMDGSAGTWHACRVAHEHSARSARVCKVPVKHAVGLS